MTVSEQTRGCSPVNLCRGRYLQLPEAFCLDAMRHSDEPHVVVRYSARLGCIEICHPDRARPVFDWQEGATKEEDDDRIRCYFGSSYNVRLGEGDKIKLPGFLRHAAGIGHAAILLGTGEQLELWDPIRLMGHPGSDDTMRSMILYLSRTGRLKDCGADRQAFPEEREMLTEAINRQEEASPAPVSEAESIKPVRLCYRWDIRATLGSTRVVDYISPILKLDAAQWTIAVTRHGKPGNRKRMLEVFWREADDVCDVIAPHFPTDWHMAENWPDYNPADDRMRGLPEELLWHYRAHKDELNRHLLGQGEAKWRQTLSDMASSINRVLLAT
ncbi:MAG: hypothetical protein ACK5NN_07675 [Sphingomonadaceae bacterium]